MASRKLGEHPQRGPEIFGLGLGVEREGLNGRVAVDGVLEAQSENGHAKSGAVNVRATV